MPHMTNFLENRMIDWFFRRQTYVPPPALYVGLFMTTPTDTAPGIEPSAPSYRRAGIASSLQDWSGTDAPTSTAPSMGESGMTFNLSEIIFPDPLEDWGVCTHVGIFDSLAGGNYLFWAELLRPRDFVLGDVNIKFFPGEISVQIDN